MGKNLKTLLYQIKYILRIKKPDYSRQDILKLRIERFEDHVKASHYLWHIKNKKHDGFFKSCCYAWSSNLKHLNYGDVQRKMAYESLAVLLGGGQYVPHTQYAIALLSKDNKDFLIRGSFQEKAEGLNIYSMPREKRIEKITPSFQRAVNWLRLFDVVAHEADHSLNNYYPVVDGSGNFKTICAFDNGGSGSFPLSSSISFDTYYGCDSLFEEGGRPTSPYFDKGLVNCICNVRYSDVKRALKRYLKYSSIYFTWRRIKKIKKNIERHSDEIILMDINDWNYQTIEDELSGKYGNTYLYSLVYQWPKSEGK